MTALTRLVKDNCAFWDCCMAFAITSLFLLSAGYSGNEFLEEILVQFQVHCHLKGTVNYLNILSAH